MDFKTTKSNGSVGRKVMVRVGFALALYMVLRFNTVIMLASFQKCCFLRVLWLFHFPEPG